VYINSYWEAPIVTDIRTPLETISLPEILMEGEGSVSLCNDVACWFDIAQNVTASWYGGYPRPYEGAEQCLSPYAPCPTPDYTNETGYIESGIVIRKSWGSEYHRFSSFHVPDPSQVLQKKQSNFASLLVFSEERALVAQGLCQGALLPSSICTCSGRTFTYGEMLDTPTPHSAIGVAIYLFAPKQLLATNPETKLKEFVWDIHSARRDANIISPYRCLTLEEYVNTALVETQTFLDNATTIPKSDVDTLYTLNHYGFEVTDGFVSKGRVEVKPK
jgi:hypothetical protein